MTFDKSKVCVAGLHDVPVGTKGYFSDEICNLRDYVKDEDKDMYGTIIKEPQDDWYKIIGKNGETSYYRFFYPCEEKVKYRPYETIEELYKTIGKVIVDKNMAKKLIVITVENYCNTLFINNMSVAFAFDNYTFEDGTPVGVEV